MVHGSDIKLSKPLVFRLRYYSLSKKLTFPLLSILIYNFSVRKIFVIHHNDF